MRDGEPAIDEATHDGARAVGVRVVLEYGADHPGQEVVRVRDGSLHEAPSVVLATLGAGPLKIHFLLFAPPHVCDPQVAGLPVELESPWIAQAVGPDLAPSPAPAHERVVRRDPIRFAALRVRVDPKHLRQQDPEVLAVQHRVALASTVAHADVEVAVWPEHDVAAVVVGERLVDQQDQPRAARVGPVAVHEVLDDVRVAAVVRVVDVEEPAVRGEGEAEQPALPARADLPAYVQRGLGIDVSAPYRHDLAPLLRYVQGGIAGTDRHGQSTVEARDLP